MYLLRQAFEVPSIICKIILISCDKGSIAAPNKKGDNGTYVKYYPSSPFSPSVALGALLTRNWVVVLIKVAPTSDKKYGLALRRVYTIFYRKAIGSPARRQ